MPTRRHFLGGLLASGFAATPGWADVGGPRYLSAARDPDGQHALIGLDTGGHIKMRVSLPDRGHAAAAHPTRPHAVAFARRPGRFAMVTDCLTGQIINRLDAPAGFHFYGHGCFADDGTVLFTTEQEIESAAGMIGLWDTTRNYRRIGAFPSNGVGPHDLRLMPGGGTLVVANGGIETHPATGRAKLNLPTMRPNLSYFSLGGELLEEHEPPHHWHKNSIRHLAVSGEGTVAIACQWQGDLAETPPLLATHRRGQVLEFHTLPPGTEQAMQGYAGSVAMTDDGQQIALTGPRGGRAVIANLNRGMIRTIRARDVCGVACGEAQFLFTTGEGHILDGSKAGDIVASHTVAWDNHLIAIPSTG